MLPKKIVVFGASTVYGKVDPEGGGFASRFRRWHEHKHPSNLVYALGIPGDTLPSMLERFNAEVKFRRPDLILLSVGLNDIHREGARTASSATPLPRYGKAIEELLTSAKKLAPTFWIGQFPIDERRTAPLHGSSWFYLASDAEAYIKDGERICRNLSVPYLSVWDAWKTQNLETLLHTDGLHCNSHGHQKLFEMVRDFIVSSLG
jgi:lysophospholipase L1-like esterase